MGRLASIFYLLFLIYSLGKMFMTALELENYEIFKNQVIEFFEANAEEKISLKKDALFNVYLKK